MPHHPDDKQYGHLRIRAESPNPERRKRQAPPQSPPNRGGRKEFAEQFDAKLEEFEEAASARETFEGVEPHLVFKVPLSEKASPAIIAEQLRKVGVSVVSVEADNAVVAFKSDDKLQEFREAIATYAAGPTVNTSTGERYKSTQWDVLEHVEANDLRLWGRNDRIGQRLSEQIGAEGQDIGDEETFVLDLELWHRGTEALTRCSIAEVHSVLQQCNENGACLDEFIGRFTCLLRVRVSGATLEELLETEVVAEIEMPPQPNFSSTQVFRATKEDFPTPPKPNTNNPSLCVIDSGITANHPLLGNNVGHATSVLTANESESDGNGHGTMVAGLAVFGNVRQAFTEGSFQSDITLYSARVLNDDNRFDDETLIIEQMRNAIESFLNPPYNCRVFNISIGTGEAWLAENQRQGTWAEALDILARELDVVIVISAGNHGLGYAINTEEAEEIRTDYPDFLFDEDCGLCEPATAAIPVVVGGIAATDVPDMPRQFKENDIVQVIAQQNEPSPLTRIGPGMNDAIKPEFVAAAGNYSFQGFGGVRQVSDDKGLAVMSLSNEPTKSLFSFDVGTSFAAPLVSRSASRLMHNLEEELGEPPQANLVRALLASSSHIPNQAGDLLTAEYQEQGIKRVYGYGVVDDDMAMSSADRRVTLFSQGEIDIDTFQVFEIPAPDDFRAANGQKAVTVTLAFDPPVRRRRKEYLGVRLGYNLIRGKTLDEVVEAYRSFSAEEKKKAKDRGFDIPTAFQGAHKCKLHPGSESLKSSTLQKSTWSFSREGSDYGDTWFIVVTANRVWAPEDITSQRFALTVTLEADEPRLYNLVRQRVQVRERERLRSRS